MAKITLKNLRHYSQPGKDFKSAELNMYYELKETMNLN